MKAQMRKARTKDKAKMRAVRRPFCVGIGFHPRGRESRMSSVDARLGDWLGSLAEVAVCVGGG
jgi:hypothetical protein